MNDTPTQPSWKTLAAPAVAAVLLLGMGVGNLGFPTADDAEPYHAAVLQAQADAPKEFGPWTSRPIDLPPSAIELLKPNMLLSRAYEDQTGRRYASFLIVQCKDARDLGGHWPPNCYQATGHTQAAAANKTWSVDGIELPGVEYVFEKTTSDGTSRPTVANFLVLPGVGYVPDMAAVRDAGADHRRRYYGAAQVQVVTYGDYSEAQRTAIFEDLIRAHLPLIQTIAEVPEP